MFNKFWSQISANSSLKDVKKRLVDHLRSAGVACTMDDVRLWLHSEDYGSSDQKALTKACETIAAGTTPES